MQSQAPGTIHRTLAERERLFAENKKLAFSACNGWMRRHSAVCQRLRLEREDLDAVALAALWTATEKWEPSRAKFSTMATLAVRSHLGHVLVGCTRERRGGGEGLPLSLDAVAPGSETATLAETLTAPLDEMPEHIVFRTLHYPELWAAVAKLSPRQAEYVRLCFQDGLTLAEIAEHLSVSRQSVQQTVKVGLVKLRAACPHLDPVN